MYCVAASFVIVSGVERLVRQCKPKNTTTSLTVFCINMSLVAESNDWYVSAINHAYHVYLQCFALELPSFCHREGVKCLQNLLEGDDMK